MNTKEEIKGGIKRRKEKVGKSELSPKCNIQLIYMYSKGESCQGHYMYFFGYRSDRFNIQAARI
jgi:hypothetical protein